MSPIEYNYAVFPPEDDVQEFVNFANHPKVGSLAPDADLVELETGESTKLSAITRQGITILELGSLT